MNSFKPSWEWALSLIAIGVTTGITVAIASKYMDNNWCSSKNELKDLETLANNLYI